MGDGSLKIFVNEKTTVPGLLRVRSGWRRHHIPGEYAGAKLAADSLLLKIKANINGLNFIVAVGIQISLGQRHAKIWNLIQQFLRTVTAIYRNDAVAVQDLAITAQCAAGVIDSGVLRIGPRIDKIDIPQFHAEAVQGDLRL